MENLQARWQKSLVDMWKDKIESLSVPAFVYVLNGGEPLLANGALRSLVPGDGLSASIEPAAPLYSPLCGVTFTRGGRAVLELVFDVFSVPAFTEKGHRTAVFGLRRERGGQSVALLDFVSSLMEFYGGDLTAPAMNTLDALPAGGAVMNGRGEYRHVSRLIAEWSGTSAAKMRGRPVFDFCDGAVSEDLLKKLTGGEISEISWTADGGKPVFSRIRVCGRGLIIQAAVLNADGEARESEEEAREQKRKLEEIVNRSETVVFALLPERNWTFGYVSENIGHFGISPDSASRLGDYIEDYPRFKAKACRALANRHDFTDRLRLVNDRGAVFCVRADMRIVNAAPGVRIEGSLTDISGEETLKRRLREARERADGNIEILFSGAEGGEPPDITEIISAGDLQYQQDRFSEAFRLPSQIFDYSGREITESCGDCMECSELCGAKSNRACKLWDAAAAKLKTAPDGAAVVSCGNSSATAAFFPIYAGKRLAAVWKIGAILLDGASGAGHDARADGSLDFPRCEPDAFQLAVDTLTVISRNISAFAANCVKLARDVNANEALRRENEDMLAGAGRIADCAAYVSSDGGDGGIDALMDGIGRAFGFDRLYIYTNRVLTREWLDRGARPAAVRELTRELWDGFAARELTVEAAKNAHEPAQTIWRPVRREGLMFALVGADCCLERREFSERELALLDLALLSAGELSELENLRHDEAAAAAALERGLGNAAVIDYRAGTAIFGGAATAAKIGRLPSLIDDDGRLSPPVSWKNSGGKRFTAAPFYWRDGRLAALVRAAGEK